MDKKEELVKLLINKKYTISFAESCTGGKMAAAIVDVADASKVLNASFVTYANEAKIKYAGVLPETLEKSGFRRFLPHVPDRNRTCGVSLRRRTLYPTEVLRHIIFS